MLVKRLLAAENSPLILHSQFHDQLRLTLDLRILGELKRPRLEMIIVGAGEHIR